MYRCIRTLAMAAVVAGSAMTLGCSNQRGVAASVGDSSEPGPSSLGAQPALVGGSGELTVSHDGVRRSYTLRVPDTTHHRGALPLVVVMHGGGGNAENVENMTGFTPVGAREGFLVAYPNGSGGVAGSLLTWNAEHCCGDAMRDEADDVGFVAAVIDDVARRHRVDPNRLYLTGMSNGAMMSHRGGIELSDRIAAIAPVVGAVFGDEPMPASPVSAFIINGARDESVPVAGGISGGRPDQWDGTPMLAAPEQAAFWARANGCADDATSVDEGPLQRIAYDCPAGLDVVLTIVGDGGHAWPGGERGSRLGDTPSESMDATEAIWSFFAAHPKTA